MLSQPDRNLNISLRFITLRPGSSRLAMGIQLRLQQSNPVHERQTPHDLVKGSAGAVVILVRGILHGVR